MFQLRLALVAAAALVVANAAAAQEAGISSGGQAIGRLFEGLGLRRPPPPAPDFVRESRTKNMDYVPLTPTPEKNDKQRAAELRAAGAALERAAAQARQRAARVKAPD
jgi:hypothetical protein